MSMTSTIYYYKSCMTKVKKPGGRRGVMICNTNTLCPWLWIGYFACGVLYN